VFSVHESARLSQVDLAPVAETDGYAAVRVGRKLVADLKIRAIDSRNRSPSSLNRNVAVQRGDGAGVLLRPSKSFLNHQRIRARLLRHNLIVQRMMVSIKPESHLRSKVMLEDLR
jgi:hypothetical protein